MCIVCVCVHVGSVCAHVCVCMHASVSHLLYANQYYVHIYKLLDAVYSLFPPSDVIKMRITFSLDHPNGGVHFVDAADSVCFNCDFVLED